MTNTIDRKTLAQALAAELGTEARYLGVPSCAYQVGDYTINRDGSIDGDLEAIHDFLVRQGYIKDEPAEQDIADANTDPAPAVQLRGAPWERIVSNGPSPGGRSGSPW